VKSSDLSVGMEVAYAYAMHELRGGSLSRGIVVAVRVKEAWLGSELLMELHSDDVPI
jgi:hypothetical protein